jgi:hypothetical protein
MTTGSTLGSSALTNEIRSILRFLSNLGWGLAGTGAAANVLERVGRVFAEVVVILFRAGGAFFFFLGVFF